MFMKNFICYFDFIRINGVVTSSKLVNTCTRPSVERLVIALLCSFVFGEIVIANSESEKLFNSGLAHYENKQYNEAIKELEVAVKKEPQVADYHHLLAKSYGREAEKANWFRAIQYAKKTLVHLEFAAELDNQNIDILDDLMDYYREAPVFLGGDSEKADKIERLIKKFSTKENLTKRE